MPTYRCPVLIWKNSAGIYTASLVEQHGRAAVAANVKDALEQLRSLLDWQYREEPWRDPPDLKAPDLIQFKVPVRPEYQDQMNGRRFPVAQPIEMRVYCVVGQQSGGPRMASLPMIGLRLQLSDHDDIKTVIPQMVQRWFEGQTPRQLSRHVPPEDVFLEDVFVAIDANPDFKRLRLRTEQLERVADPLGDSKVRSLFGRAWERDSEVHAFAQQLREDKGKWLVIGESGSGKTTVLCEAIRHVERSLNQEENADEESVFLKPQRRFWQTSAGRLISGMKYLGQWEERLENVIRELNDIEGVLCIESLLDLIRTGGREATDSIASFCIPYLQRGELRLVAEVTPAELDACRRLLPGLVDLFQVVTLQKLDAARAERVLDHVAEHFASSTRLTIAGHASSHAVRLFERFQPYHALPGEVVSFWSEHLDRCARSKSHEVPINSVLKAFLRRTGLPEQFLRDDLPMTRDSVLSHFESEIMGQTAACEAATDVVIQFKAGMNDPRRPLGVLLFCGPTGVGKTELAKSMSRFLFGASAGEVSSNGTTSETAKKPEAPRMIRLDMSEYAGPWAADRLLMQASGEPSDFLQQIRRQPFTVLLLDEIEKAHPSVYDVLMNVFDEGRLTDRFGRVTWFRSTVILLTSNLGADSSGLFGFGDASPAATSSRHEAAVREFFRPEFFNRLDGVIAFDPLSQQSILNITEKELRSIAAREGLKKSGVTLTWTPDVVHHLARTGYDARYGARPLQRTLETLIVAPLSRLLVERNDGATSVVRCVMRDGTVMVE
jgi:ATP-dependent Clp protease ATP-binding subunit ClpC